MTLCIHICVAQTKQNLGEFIRSTPWELTDSELSQKYSNSFATMPDTIQKILATQKIGDLTISPNIIGNLAFNDIDAYVAYTIGEENNKPQMMLCILNPSKTQNETDVMDDIDKMLTTQLGSPMSDILTAENRTRDYGNGVTATISNVWECDSCALTSISFNVTTEEGIIQVYAIMILSTGSSQQEREEDKELSDLSVKFRGIPINGDLDSFCKELILLGYKRDYSFTPTNNVGASFTGLYAGQDCTLYIYLTPSSKTVYKVRVIVSETRSWSILKNSYYKFKNLFNNKYGEPWKEEESFEYPYKDGDGLELYSIRDGKGSYYSSFKNTDMIGIGFIDVIINASYLQGWLTIDFTDGMNMLLNEAELSNEL